MEMKKLFTGMCCLILAIGGWAQKHSEKINRELSFEKKSAANALIIANINGQVNVTGYEGDKIVVEVEKVIMAKTDERLERGKSEIQLGIVDLADTLILYVDGLCGGFGRTDGKRNWSRVSGGWGYNWNNECNNREGRQDYEYRMNFTVKVPASLNLSVSTINNGDVQVQNVKGAVHANNINGAIKLSKLAGKTEAHTINGDVDLDYVDNPRSDCRYYSLNGDINAFFRKGLAANVSFESFNGDLYTNIDQLVAMPTELEKKETSKGMKYKIGGMRYQVGSGGVRLDFETFNGNVYLKEN